MPMLVDTILRFIKRFIPRRLFALAQPSYHYLLAILGMVVYGFPARRITVIGITGTKGKSSVTELLNAMFEEAGFATALSNSIRTKVAGVSVRNMHRMTMPGRFALQRLLRRAIRAGAHVAILEITSEGVRQYRHRFLALDALIFTNLAPEHIESHGSLEKYAEAKLQIGQALVSSKKRPRTIIANADDPYGSRFLTLSVEHALPFSLKAAEPYRADEKGAEFTFRGARLRTNMPGVFSIYNALAGAVTAAHFGVPFPVISRALERLQEIPGRAQRINQGQPFAVVVDYAHTPDSLAALYSAYANKRKICVLGATGGGRDHWKRPAMGAVAESHCEHIILTNEDPYNEDPRSIVDGIARGMQTTPEIIMDRRAAIARAFDLAHSPEDAVLITGKGTDPSICIENGKRIPWSDAEVAREELQKRFRTADNSRRSGILPS